MKFVFSKALSTLCAWDAAIFAGKPARPTGLGRGHLDRGPDGQPGKFVKVAAKLPAGRFERAVWLDFDHDYDLDLFLLGEKSVLLRNEGEHGFQDYTAHFPFAAGRVVDALAFRLIPDSKGIDLLVSYADRAAVLYRDQMRAVFEAVPVDAVPAGAHALEERQDLGHLVGHDFDHARQGGSSRASGVRRLR